MFLRGPAKQGLSTFLIGFIQKSLPASSPALTSNHGDRSTYARIAARGNMVCGRYMLWTLSTATGGTPRCPEYASRIESRRDRYQPSPDCGNWLFEARSKGRILYRRQEWQD